MRRWEQAGAWLLALLLGGLLLRLVGGGAAAAVELASPPASPTSCATISVAVEAMSTPAPASVTPSPPLTSPAALPPTWTPTTTPLPAPTATPPPTLTPSPTPEPERWIEVVLSTQTLNAYEGDRLVRSWKVSTGLPRTPTPVGDFRIWVKLRYDDMEGPGYYLPNVPYVMYFYGGYGIHGVYWHANFGHPMSHGCVNMPTDGAAWLFDWASVGTPVRIRP